MCCKTDPDELARRRMQAAFGRCDNGTCCPAATWHRPHCARRAERLLQDFTRPDKDPDPNLTQSKHWVPEMETRSEIGGRRGCVQVVAAIALITALAMVFSWWVVYG